MEKQKIALFKNEWFGYAAAFCMVLVSLGTYLIVRPGYHFPVWQVLHHDHGDFRFLAEIFWNMPHDFSTYGSEFQANWGNFMNAIPFRGIFPGSFYLFMRWIVSLVSSGWGDRPLLMGTIVSGTMKFLQCAAYLTFYHCCRKSYGIRAALGCLFLLLFPIHRWGITEELLAEPMLRIAFTFMLAILVSIHSRETLKRSAAGFMLILILCAHMKSQWATYALFMVPFFFAAFHYSGFKWRDKIPFITLAVAAPLSVLLVNGLVWGDYTLTPGSGFHANLKTHGHFISQVCGAPTQDLTIFCGKNHDVDWFWHIYMGTDVPPESYRALDARSMSFFMDHPSHMLTDFMWGLRVASNYPAGVWGGQDYSANTLVLLIDMFTWLALLVGLTHKETQLFAAAAIGLWLVPAGSAMFAVYETRYHRPMAGIPLALAIIILIRLIKLYEHAQKPRWLEWAKVLSRGFVS